MKCPICSQAITDSEFECTGCGESMSLWRIITLSASQIRQRGLCQALERDFVGASLSFLEAALTNPIDKLSLIDAGKSLAHLGRIEDAIRLLEIAQNRYPDSSAADVLAAVRGLQSSRQMEDLVDEGDGDVHFEAAPEDSPASERDPSWRPLLKLPLLTRNPRWIRRLRGRGKSVDPIWESIIRMESEWDGDWSALHDLLAIGVGRREKDQKNHPAFHYLLGLEGWQHNDCGQASTQFNLCLKSEPGVLNAAAYLICLARKTPESTRQLFQHLIEAHSFQRGDIDTLVRALKEKFNSEGASPQLEQFERHLEVM